MAAGGGMEEVEASLREKLSPWPTGCSAHWVRTVNTAQTAVELEAVRRSVARGRPLGSADWTRRTVSLLGLESTVTPHRQPHKAEMSENES
jgi:putative transposase